MLRQCFQKVFQVVVRVRTVCFRCLDQGEQGCGSFGTGDGIAEQPVAPGGRKGRNESEDTSVPDGAFGYRSDAQCVHAPGAGGRSCGDGQNGGDRDSEKRAGEDRRKEGYREHGNTENVQGCVKKNGAHHLRVVGFFTFGGGGWKSRRECGIVIKS